MRWTTAVGVFGALLGLSGCVYGYRTAFVGARYSGESRPDASYYCYDCHGYRFFDPYYDWCASRGFRYRWDRHPRVLALYRERYVRIRETHPEYGRYRYRPGYRASTRYREDRDYESWRREEPARRSIERPDPAGHESGKPAPKERGEKNKGPKERKGGGGKPASSRGGI
jgi:hypothetical protein